jgi:hypothetical protein
LLATNGVRGLFQGFTATAARDAPYAGLYVVFYEKGKDLASTSWVTVDKADGASTTETA